MNLFRSEEHVRRWTGFDPESAAGILPAAQLHARLFARFGRYRERLAPDYLYRVGELSAGVLDAFADLSGGSSFWKPR
jgi:hypothetical protein